MNMNSFLPILVVKMDHLILVHGACGERIFDLEG